MKRWITLFLFLAGATAALAKKIEGTIVFTDNQVNKVTFIVPVNFLTQEVTFHQFNLK